ncbi:MAG: TIGR02147 family protein [Fibrobacterales bacterium]
MTTIFNYFNYHEFLKDWFRTQKELRSGVTLQSITDAVGIKSKSYLHRITRGTARLSEKSLPALCRALKLNQGESDYLSLLVQFKHSKSDNEKNGLLVQIQALANSDAFELEQKKYIYFSKWYIPAIRELVTCLEFGENYQRLGRALTPVISVKEAKEAIQLLLELDLIEKEGVLYRQKQNIVIAKSDIDFLALRNYQKSLIDLGYQSIDRFTPNQRETLSICAGVSKDGYAQLSFALKEFQKRVVEILNQTDTVELTCQINTQVFPVSKIISQKGIDYES